MPPNHRMTIGAWMRLAVVVAGNMVLVREAAMLFVIPSSALLLVALNLALFRSFVRLRPPDAFLIGALVCGLLLSIAIFGAHVRFLNWTLNLHQEGVSMTRPRFVADYRVVWYTEYALLVACGVLLMISGGWLVRRASTRAFSARRPAA